MVSTAWTLSSQEPFGGAQSLLLVIAIELAGDFGVVAD